MSTTLVAILIALVGIVGVLAVSYTFYAVGRAEDRDREAASTRKPRPQGSDPLSRGDSDLPRTHGQRSDPHAHPKGSDPLSGGDSDPPRAHEHPPHGELARRRGRPRPPRRPG
jgi:hypothetical protein